MPAGPNFEMTEPIDRLILAIDTSDIGVAHDLLKGFAEAGGKTVKLGIEAQTAKGFGGPEGLSRLALEHGLDWIYDGKIKDIGNTMAGGITNVVSYDHPPVAITMHADTSFNGMQVAQEAAGDIPMLGVTLLTDIGPEEVFREYATKADRNFVDDAEGELMRELSATIKDEEELERRLAEELGFVVVKVGEGIRKRVVLQRATKLAHAGVKGLVASPKELAALNADPLTAPSLKLIPGTRSLGADANDQMNTMTPEAAIADGADLLVIGRQYTSAEDKKGELERLQEEVARGLERRAS